MYNVLLVEDVEECQVSVKRSLANSSINLIVKETVSQAMEYLESKEFPSLNLAILDLGLPDGDGITLLEVLRSKLHSDIPVFLLSSRAELDSKVLAFNLGADDYLIKPVSGIELRARVEMRIKKSTTQALATGHVVKGNLTLDLSLMKVSINVGKDIHSVPLTAKEFKILAVLAQDEGKVYSRYDLVKAVWGDDVHIQARTIDSHVCGLRRKIGLYADYVECIPFVGYRFLQRDITGTLL